MSHDPHPSSSNSSQNPPSTWTEPPWSGWIETTGDALLILEAARRGLIPRVTRRLVDSERKMITSGSVFVFDEDESGIKRWTDGFFWSPSRILGNFLLYRETEKRGAGHRSARADRETNIVEEQQQQQQQYPADGVKLEERTNTSLSRPKNESSRLGIDRLRERSLVGSLTNSYKFKPGGMMKKTFSLTIGGVAQHLISYYKVDDVEQGRLRSPSTLPELASLDISPEYLDKTHFRNPPKVEIGVDGIPRYRGEADDVDTSPHLLTSPLAITAGYDEPSSSSGKRSKTRYDPYNNSSVAVSIPKRPRKGKSTSQSRSNNNADTDTEPTSPTYPSPVHQPAPGYPETSLSATTNHYSAQYPYYPSYPPAYSPAPYAPPVPVSPVQPPPQSPTPPQHSPSAPQQQLAYPAYTSDSHPPPASQSAVYPYYAPAAPGYSNYPMWPSYSGYGASQHASHTASSSSGAVASGQDRAPRDDQEEGEDGT